jgi:glycosyltransferase involved in cell wall biosynthesis
MKIAHVLTSFQVGGQEKMARDLAAGQVRLGHEVTAVSLAPGPDGPLGDEFRAAGVKPVQIAKRPGFDPTLWVRLGLFFRRTGIDVVHSHNQLPLVYAAPAARMARARAVHTRHGRFVGKPREIMLRRLAARFLDACIAVSEDAAEVARRHGEVARDGVRVVENGIDTDRFGADPAARAAVRKEMSLPEDAWVVGSVGRFVWEKNYALLLRAIAPLLGDKLHLLLVGDGIERPALEALLATLPFKASVHLPGMRPDVPRLLAALDVFVLSSVSEGLPLVLLEAMAVSLPIVATEVGGIPAVMRSWGGTLVPPNDEEALRAGLARLAADRAAAVEMGRRARAYVVERYDHRRMIATYLALYEEVRARSRS